MAAFDATFQAVKIYQYPIVYLMISKTLWLSQKSEKQSIWSLCLDTRRLYNTMQYANENTTDYLVRLRNSQKVNEDCDWSLVTKGVQEHGTKIRFPLHNTAFDSLQEDEKK